MNPILLDTHAALWAVHGMLRGAAENAVDEASERGELLLSPITAFEIGTLVRTGRLQLDVGVADFVRALFGREGTVTASLTPAIALAATALPGAFHADPADRVLVATAVEYGARLMTRDKQIHDYARKMKTLRCLAC